MIESELLQILVCPKTGARLALNNEKQELVCFASALAYPIRKGVPIMLVDQARSLSVEEIESLKKELL
jgi:uncharacterized protein